MRRFVERRDRVALDAFAERFFRRRFQPLRIFELSDVFRDALRDERVPVPSGAARITPSGEILYVVIEQNLEEPRVVSRLIRLPADAPSEVARFRALFRRENPAFVDAENNVVKSAFAGFSANPRDGSREVERMRFAGRLVVI